MPARWSSPWAPIIVGAVLRLVAGASGFGYFASDDYRYVIAPAGQWLHDPEHVFPSTYRSVLWPRLVWLMMGLADGLGFEDPASRLRVVYSVIGLLSVPAIPLVYGIAKWHLGAKAALQGAWLVAAFALMPRISTRALIEMASVVPLLFGWWCLQRAKRWPWAFGAGLACGVAAMFRFQLGVVFPVFLLVVARRWPRCVVPLMVGGGVAALAQGGLDLASHGRWFGSLLGYVAFNSEHADKFGTSAWHTYVVMLALLTLPPITFWLAKPMAQAMRRDWELALALGVFVLVHSLIGHKEERFMFPVLPLYFVFVGAALAQLLGDPSRRRVVWIFWGINAAVLPIAVFSDGQRNSTVPLVEVARHAQIHRVATVGKAKHPHYYAGPQTRFVEVRTVAELAPALAPLAAEPTRVVFKRIDPKDGVEQVRALGYRCDPLRDYPGDFVDQVLMWVNPRGNRRRGAYHVSDCWPAKGAGS